MGCTASRQRVQESDSKQADTQDGTAERERTQTGSRESASQRSGGTRHGYVDYDRGPGQGTLANRYGLEVGSGQTQKLAQLESEFGSDRVQRWADEGMTVKAMGKPRDMRAFRERQASRSGEIPTDIEQRNQASRRRNRNAERDDGAAGDAGVPDVVRRVVASSGRSMDESVQREMESKMGGEFGDVQVHSGPEAAAAAESINARAFTVGNHVAFNKGEYNPSSNDGKRILAHELTHVRQQTDGRVSLLPKADADGDTVGVDDAMHVQPKLEVSSPNDPAEKEAERVAERVVNMDDDTAVRATMAGVSAAAAGAAIQRQETSGGGQQTKSGGETSAQGGGLEGSLKQNTSLDDGTISKLVKDIRNNGLGEDTIMRLVDQFGWVFGTLGSVAEMVTLAKWADSLKAMGFSADSIADMWRAFFTNPPWGGPTPLLNEVGRLSELNKIAGTLGDALSVIGAALTGWKIGRNLRQGKIGPAFAEAYKGFMGIAAPIGGLIDGAIKVIHLVFGNVPYLDVFADVLKSLNPIELGGIAVDTLISVIHAIVAATTGGNAFKIMLKLEGRIEKVAWPIIKLSEVSGLQAVMSAGFDTLFTICGMIADLELSTEQVRNLVERFKQYGLGPLVTAGNKLGAAAFEATEAASSAWNSVTGAASGTWSSVTSYF